MLELKEHKRVLQELLTHPGWQAYKDLLLVKFRAQEQARLEAAGRAGDGVQCAKHAYMLEKLPAILKLPENEYKKL